MPTGRSFIPAVLVSMFMWYGLFTLMMWLGSCSSISPAQEERNRRFNECIAKGYPAEECVKRQDAE